MHTAGFYFTGQVDIESRLTVTAGGPVQLATTGGTETPFASIVNTLFLTVFGRRLGTTSDGTSLRPNPKSKGTVDVSNAYEDPFTANTRDVTLQQRTDIKYLSRLRNNITDSSGTVHDVRSGYAYAGPRYGTLNRFLNTAFGTSSADSYASTFQNLNALRIFGTKTALDGQTPPIFLLTASEAGRKIKMNYAFPSQFAISAHLFSNTLTKFDLDSVTFDDTTP